MLSLQTFTTLVQNMAAAVQAQATSLLDLTVGSVLRAILEANASVALWLQWLLVLLMNRERLSTSVGADVDSFVNDFQMYRLPAVAAVGQVTFSRFSYANSAATIPVGATCITGDGTQTFVVGVNTADPFYNAAQSAYILPPGTPGDTVPVTAQVAGSAGNVQPNTITLLGQAIVGIDTCTNAVATSGGQDAETDAAVKARFPNYIASLAKATTAAISAAIADTQQGLTYYINPNVSTSGAYMPGNIVVTVDDGTGNPSSTLLANVQTNVQAVMACGESLSVQGPTVTEVAVAFTLTVASGVNKTNVIPTVEAAVTQYINTLPVGASLPYSVIPVLAFAALPSGQVTNVTNLLLNGATADITVGPSGVIKNSTCVVS